MKKSTTEKSQNPEKSKQTLAISSIKLQNIGPFDELGLTINFGKKLNTKKANNKANIHIFVGENGSGKSSVLKTLFFGSYQDKKSLITENNGNFFENLNPEDKQWSIFKNWQNVFYYTPNEPAIKQKESLLFYTPKNKDSRNNLISNWICEYVEENYLDKIKELENSRDKLLANDKKEEKLDKQGIEEIEILIKMTEHIEEFIKNIYVNLDFKYKWKNTKELYKPYINGKFFEFNNLSLGYKQIISLITDILIKVWAVDSKLEKREELVFILLLDEIDIHLHPKAQRKILPALQTLFPNAEIFCTTHSPFVVNSVSDAWVYKLNQKHGIIEPISSNNYYGKPIEEALDEEFDISYNDLFDTNTQEKLDNFKIQVKDFYKKPTRTTLEKIKKEFEPMMKISREVAEIINFNLQKMYEKIS